jgi:hypothetical protein
MPHNVAKCNAIMLFRSEKTEASRRERDEKLERALSDGLRKLAKLFLLVADGVEARRLERNGYVKSTHSLERVDASPGDKHL